MEQRGRLRELRNCLRKSGVGKCRLDGTEQHAPLGGSDTNRRRSSGADAALRRQPVPGNVRQKEQQAECCPEFQKHAKKEIDRSFALHSESLLELRLARRTRAVDPWEVQKQGSCRRRCQPRSSAKGVTVARLIAAEQKTLAGRG